MHQFYVKPDVYQISVVVQKVRNELSYDDLTVEQLSTATGMDREQVQEALRRLENEKEVSYCRANKCWELVA